MAVTQITTRQIRDSAVTAAKIASSAVVFSKLSLAANPGLEDGGSGAIQVKVDGTTIARTAAGLEIAADGVGPDELGILTTKGDLIGFSTLPTRLGVGTNGQVLTANSGEATGLEWTTPVTGFAKSDIVNNEIPSGTVDGTNDDFVLANTPEAGTVCVYVNGVRQQEGSGNDYQIAADTITFEAGAIPQTNDVILVDYVKD